MISPVSSQAAAYIQNAQAAAKTQASTPASQPSSGQDKVELSAQAKAALSGGDADHDGDSH